MYEVIADQKKQVFEKSEDADKYFFDLWQYSEATKAELWKERKLIKWFDKNEEGGKACTH